MLFIENNGSLRVVVETGALLHLNHELKSKKKLYKYVTDYVNEGVI